MKIHHFYSLILSLLFTACGNSANQSAAEEKADIVAVPTPRFNADSAYLYVEKQVGFGARVPNTAAHEACKTYLANELRRFGAEVTEQNAQLKAFDNTMLDATNIIGSFNSAEPVRILLAAHWDSRPFADNDSNPDNYRKAISGANDGASGVGVLLEIARQLGEKLPSVGVDIILFDAEDYGQPRFDKGREAQDSWCLGSQYWAKHPHNTGYRARYGILLDMVGAKNPTFLKDKVSMMYAPRVAEKVWREAQRLGYSDLFKDGTGGYITDDHLYVNELAGIPCVDIIDFDEGFFEHWHTVRDDMEHIDKATLKAVGQTLLEVVFKEN